MHAARNRFFESLPSADPREVRGLLKPDGDSGQIRKRYQRGGAMGGEWKFFSLHSSSQLRYLRDGTPVYACRIYRAGKFRPYVIISPDCRMPCAVPFSLSP